MRALVLEPELHLIDLALFLPQARVLVIADLHLGIEEALRHEGVFVPRSHLSQIQQRLERILQTLQISRQDPLSRLIINGDLRHQFGPLSQTEAQEARQLLRLLSPCTDQILLIAGNHDGDLSYLERDHSNVTVTKAHREENCWIVHGDEIISQELTPHPHPLPLPERERVQRSWIVIGHEHPAISLRDPITERTEVYKCFLVGRYERENLLVLPSFNQLVRGSDLTKEAPLSPYLKDLENFSVYPVSDDGAIYEFGSLRRLVAAL
jgi:putative SbcD/Mre11-related phosphoesterase